MSSDSASVTQQPYECHGLVLIPDAETIMLLRGKRVIDLNMETPMPLDKMARCFTSGNDSTEFADPKHDGDFPTEAFRVVLNLALSCTGPKKQRPSMEEVMFKLGMTLKLSREVESFTLSTSVMA